MRPLPPISPQPNVGRAGDLAKFPRSFWVAILVTGSAAGLAGGLLMRLLFAVQGLCWGGGPGDFTDAVARAGALRRIAVLCGAGLLVGIARRAIRLVPGGGHGGELSESIWFNGGILPGLATYTKAVVSVAIVGMGAAVGREGALKQSGAAIGSKLAECVKLSAAQRRLLAACGAGAGMAAAYNVPFGGALFALEGLLGTLSLPLVIPAVGCSVIATAVSWLLLPMQATYEPPAFAISARQIAWAALAGPILGVASAMYVRLIVWADRRKPDGLRAAIAPAAMFALLGAAAAWFPQLLGNGKEVVQRTLAGSMPLGLMAALTILRPAATAWCLASGAPGGLFTPTMTLGALLGGTLGHLWAPFDPQSAPGVYALLGSGAVLAAATQAPISSVVLMMELTRRADPVMAPMLLAALLATAVSRRLEPRSIYSARVRADEAAAMQKASPEQTVLPTSAPYAQTVRRLLEAERHGSRLFAVNAQGRIVGEVTAEAVERAETATVPLDTTTAGDLAV